MNKIVFIVLLCFMIVGEGLAQQEVQFTQFMYNKLYYNPAYAGVRGGASLKAMYRHQWLGFEGAPKSRLISFDLPVFEDKVGFGLTFVSHEQGITDTWQSSMAYSYNLKIKEGLLLRFGFQGSLRYYGINFNDPDFIVLQENDPSIMENVMTENYYGNFGFGTYLLYKQFYVGLSIPNFYGNDIGFNPNNLDDFAKEVKHFYAMTGVTLPVNNQITLRPALLTKYAKNAPFDVEANLNMTYNSQITLGLSYRAGGDKAGESIDILAMYQMTKLAIGASYDISISPIREHSSGSIEALIRYDFTSERTDMANPRFFY